MEFRSTSFHGNKEFVHSDHHSISGLKRPIKRQIRTAVLDIEKNKIRENASVQRYGTSPEGLFCAAKEATAEAARLERIKSNLLKRQKQRVREK